MTTSTYPLETMLSVLGTSHARLAAMAGPLTAEEVAGPSYDADWSIAQVLSHLGSGAEIFGLMLDAGLRGADAPASTPTGDVGPLERQEPGRPGPRRHRRRRRVPGPAAALDPAEREGWRLAFLGDERGLTEMAQMRLGGTPCTPGTSPWPGTAGDAGRGRGRADPGHAARAGRPDRRARRRDSARSGDHRGPGAAFRAGRGPDGVTSPPAPRWCRRAARRCGCPRRRSSGWSSGGSPRST